MKKFLSLLLVIALLVGMVGCAKPEPSPSPDPDPAPVETTEPEPDPEPEVPAYGELSIYSAMPEIELPSYLAAFEADTGIKVNVVRLSAGEMLTRIEAENANPLVSVMHGGPSDTYVSAVGKGLLAQYQPEGVADAPEAYRDATGYWSPIYMGAIAFACNTDWFAEKGVDYPASWADLLKPEFKGEISMAHPTTSGTAYTVLATIMQLYGEDRDAAWNYMKELNKNIRQYTKSGGAAPQQAALGEAAIAITFSHDALVYANQGYPVKLTFPSEGTGYEVGAVAILANGIPEEAENAKIFVEWCMSARAQEVYIENESCRLPVNVNAKVTEGLTQLSEINTINYDAVWAGDNKSDLNAQFMEMVDAAANLFQ
ncbi:ABC transporter substrate-binding protein [Christensenellaceae bacterium OttesenSCG-928-L17]|nr:ABC transporter substrate-binding protein [Christensenellaceae bacterium OttesenSCG-928-L17]